MLRSKQTANLNPVTSAKIASIIEKIVEGFFCSNCDCNSDHKSHIQEHIKKHIEGLEYPCGVCNKVLRLSLYCFINHKKDLVFCHVSLKFLLFRSSGVFRNHSCDQGLELPCNFCDKVTRYFAFDNYLRFLPLLKFV